MELRNSGKQEKTAGKNLSLKNLLWHFLFLLS
jgi:hypothetical protein